ncbi:probable G-protein coupled receptor 19 [Hippocampus zosterae]|uniref:probable G-protein coupled receptor 19 n=1 Tax=Hippocampus zosterae TaxID=109293 RepID=UPI00223DE5F7|nr:probable G-protein coupled receptor 19 [Hippocampus zosterae]
MVYAWTNTVGVERSLLAPALPNPAASFNHSEAANGSRPGAAEDGLTSGETAALALAFGALWLVSVLGNALVCVVIHRSRRAQSTTNYFVVALACADLLLSAGGAPLVLAQVAWGRWPLGAAACAAARYVQHLCPGVQAYVLLSISVDRFYSIVHPLSFKVSREKAKKMIVASCSLAAALAAPCLFFYGAEGRQCRFFPPAGRGGVCYAAAQLLLGLALPAGLVFSFYRRVVRHIWRFGADGHAVRRTMNTVPRPKVKTIKMFLVLNWLFFATWTPFYLAQLWHPREADDGDGAARRRAPLFFAAVAWVSFSSAATKPTLYSVYNANFRRGMRETFCASSIKCYRSNAYTVTASSRLAKKNYVGVLHAPVDVKDAAQPSWERDAKGRKKLAWAAGAHNTFV